MDGTISLLIRINTLPGIAFRDVNFKDVKGRLYPTIGLKKNGDHIWANFGQLPFQFDIDGYMKVCILLHF